MITILMRSRLRTAADNVDLQHVLSPDAIAPLLDSDETLERLKPFLPPPHTTAAVNQLVKSPQFAQVHRGMGSDSIWLAFSLDRTKGNTFSTYRTVREEVVRLWHPYSVSFLNPPPPAQAVQAFNAALKSGDVSTQALGVESDSQTGM
jgi:hypothetical protein